MTEITVHTGHRHSIRLRDYDYAQSGLYFVTICTKDRHCLFGDISNGVMQLNDAGAMTRRWFIELEKKYPNVQCDEFVCMPNHIHFIIANIGEPEHQQTVGADLCVRPSPFESTQKGDPDGSAPLLQKIVQWYKTMTTNEYIRGVKHDGWDAFSKRLWQRNYWEHVIRNEHELYEIREYIHNNPVLWKTDELFIIP
jgi:putative transposase